MAAGSVFQEVEAKLLAEDAAVLAAIAARDRLGPFFLVRRPTVRLETTYLDTADLLLARHGLALRLRRTGNTDWEVSTKGPGARSGVIHARPERSLRLPGPPDFPYVPSPELADGLPAAARGVALAPILISEVERQRFAVHRGAADGEPCARAELVLDTARSRGPASPAHPAETFYEVEIELEAGTRADLDRLSRLLRENFRMRPSYATKLQRGLDLLHGVGKWNPAQDT